MTEALIIGGGIAGSALAILLSRAGRSVTLIEREENSRDKVCGEFLSHDANYYLNNLGLDLPSLGAVPIDRLKLIHKNRSATTQLPFCASGLSRKVLDEELLMLASKSGATILRGKQIHQLEKHHQCWRAQADDGDVITCNHVFLATGKHDLRGWNRHPIRPNGLIAFKMHFHLSPEQESTLHRHIVLALFREGYAGLQLVEHGIANLCLLVSRKRFMLLGKKWENFLEALCAESPYLDSYLTGAIACFEKPLAISAIPYGYIAQHTKNLWRIGDQGAVIASFSGYGMSLALHSAYMAANLFLSGKDARYFQRQFASKIYKKIRYADILSQLLMHPIGQPLLSLGAQLAPQLMTGIVRVIRLPDIPYLI